MKFRKSMSIFKMVIAIVISSYFFSTQIVSGQSNKTTFINASPNTYSPNLYAEKINLQILLVNLPGIKERGSSFTGSFTIYFMPEGEIENLARSKGGVIDELGQNDISNKVLLAKGSFNKASLITSRIYEKFAIPFRSKVFDRSRTMRGKIVIFYTIKVYDALLKQNIYKDSSFTYFPFERTNVNAARKTFHLSFFVNENGKLYTSSLPREKSSTTW